MPRAARARTKSLPREERDPTTIPVCLRSRRSSAARRRNLLKAGLTADVRRGEYQPLSQVTFAEYAADLDRHLSRADDRRHSAEERP